MSFSSLFEAIGMTSTSGLLDKIVYHEHDGEQDQDKQDIRKSYMRKIKPDSLVGIDMWPQGIESDEKSEKECACAETLSCNKVPSRSVSPLGKQPRKACNQSDTHESHIKIPGKR